eukprot:TRINITY_DN12876_c0_g1_i1.p1 TRINITY_DN12876_c0_g1~~TRINITY_DN12876_c0_g1_i1.p1  ORF type:complete len:498 (+),score=48.90 TRINITY_DN12876_c0_g1_i1:175-1668(+)
MAYLSPITFSVAYEQELDIPSSRKRKVNRMQRLEQQVIDKPAFFVRRGNAKRQRQESDMVESPAASPAILTTTTKATTSSSKPIGTSSVFPSTISTVNSKKSSPLSPSIRAGGKSPTVLMSLQDIPAPTEGKRARPTGVSPLLLQAQTAAKVDKHTRNGRRTARAFLSLLRCFKVGIQPTYSLHPVVWECQQWDWNTVPPALNPASFMNDARARRKKLQLVNLIAVARQVGFTGIDPSPALYVPNNTSCEQGRRPVIVDFCSGSGHAGLMFAIAYPHCDIVLVECNYHAILSAEKRIKESGLTNVSVFHGNMDDYNEPFDLGVALHACGPLTDRAFDKCIQHRAMFLAAPCCLGKVHNQPEIVSLGSRFKYKDLEEKVDRLQKNEVIHYPRSAFFKSVLDETEYCEMAQTADYGEWDMNNSEGSNAKNSRACKAVVEYDRVVFAREQGFESFLTKMTPRDCTPKHDIIVAYPQGTGDYQCQRSLRIDSPILNSLYFT